MDQMHNKELTISEIFYSIQGESSHAGRPCIFVRLSGCNLRCNYCDAAYTWEQGELMRIADIVAAVEGYPCDLVEVTGGEPLCQENCLPLIETLLDQGKAVLLESNGSLTIDQVPDQCVAILDVKCPDSGSKDSFMTENIDLIRQRLAATPGSCELKFVLSSKKDYLWAKDFLTKHQLLGLLPLLFSPVQPSLAAEELAAWLMEDGLDVRLQLQLHTILWPNSSRGV